MQDISSKTVSRRYAKSSSFKMAVLFTILLGISAVFLGYSLYDFGQKNFMRETEDAINIEIEHIIISLGKNHSTQNIEQYISKRAEEKLNPVYYFQDKDGARLAGHLNNMPEDVTLLKEGVVSFRHDTKQVLYAAKMHTFENGSKLLVARDINDINKSYERLKLFSIMIMVFMLMVILVSFFISLFVVSRINMIAGTAKNIMDTGDLSKRISIKGNWDDLSNLAQVLNSLLDRIEALMQGIRSTSDNIAHDLRTPLTRLRNHLEDLKGNKNNESDLDSLINEADHILGTFNSLLRITNIEKSARSQNFITVNIGEIIEDVIALYEPLAEDRSLSISSNICDDVFISGDKDMLFQAFANLVDNAIKFSSKNGHIKIELSRDAKQSIFVLADNGCGVSEQERERVFDRFFRADYSRSEPGTGLGLSLVKAVLDLHQAEISLNDNKPGLRVDIKFNN